MTTEIKKMTCDEFERQCAILVNRTRPVNEAEAADYIASHSISEHELALFRLRHSSACEAHYAGSTPWEWAQDNEIAKQSHRASTRNNT